MFTLKINLSHLAPKVRKSASIVLLTEEGLEPTKLCYLVDVSRFTFPIPVAAGGRWSSTMSTRICTSWSFRLKLKYTTCHLKTCSLCFQKSCFGRKARAHRVRSVQSLVRAAHAACFLSIGRKPNKIAALLNNCTELVDYAMCCKAPDYEQWLESMIKEIKDLEKMGCWKIVKPEITSLHPGAKIINCRWVYKLRFWDGLY